MQATDNRLDNILERLIDARKAAGLSQTQAARLLGLGNASSLSVYEIGRSVPNLDMFLRMCDTYGCSPVWALTGINPDFDRETWIEKFGAVSGDVMGDLQRIADLMEMTQQSGDSTHASD